MESGRRAARLYGEAVQSCKPAFAHALHLSSLSNLLQLSASASNLIMDVLGGVASVITVVGLALQSTKVIYEVTSSISHGSDDINRLARATSNLEKLLEVTKRLAEHADSTNSVAEGKLLEELKPLVDQCANALCEISPKLIRLQKDSKDARWKKAKKYARLYLDTKGVAEIWNTVNHYVELLGSCLGTASV